MGELLGGFHPSDSFRGFKEGFIFKYGLKGLGYYEDASVAELERKATAKADEERRAALAEHRAAETNPEEIELDMDLDDEEDALGAAAPAPAAARASNFNPEEIEIDFED